MNDDATFLASYARTRDAEAFRALVDRHATLVFGTCLRVCGNRADADDAVQEVFIALARAANRIHGHLPAWLHQVSLRTALHLRGRRRSRGLATDAPAAEPDAVRALLPELDTAIAALPEDERQCVVARYLEGRTQQEIAAELGLSQPTVHRRLESAVAKLRQHLDTGESGCLAALALAMVPVPSAVQAALGKVALIGPAAVRSSARIAARAKASASAIPALVVAAALVAVSALAWISLRPAATNHSLSVPGPTPMPLPSMPVASTTSRLVPGVWTAITPPVKMIGNPAGVICITIDPSRTTTLYAGVEGAIGGGPADGNGLWKSTDGGTTWALLCNGASPYYHDDKTTYMDLPVNVAVDPADSQHLYATEGIRGANNGFWSSKDGGNHWVRTYLGDLTTMAVDPVDFRHVLAGFHDYTDLGLLESKDGGETWIVHPLVSGRFGDSYQLGFLYDPASRQGNGETWIVHTHGIWRTIDAGAHWTKVSESEGLRGATDGAGIHYATNGTVYKAVVDGLLRSKDNGASWERVREGIPNSSYRAVTGDGRDLYLMPDGYPPETGFLFSPESDGLVWKPFPGAQKPSRGPLQMRFDPVQRIVYSANWSAGLWALKVPSAPP